MSIADNATWCGVDIPCMMVNLYGCHIGKGSLIGPFVEIQKGVRIGKDCTISSHSFICEGVTIEDGVFVGHGVRFVNEKYPKANRPGWDMPPENRILVKRGASIGTGAIIMPGVTIGREAEVGAGALILRDVPDHAVAITRSQQMVLDGAVVFTNGHFDLLHVGHIDYLERARALGDMLVVGLNSDASTRRLKGPARPIVPQDERARMLTALGCVDRVIVFEEDTANELVDSLRPDIYVKGGDWVDPPEAKVVEEYGGEVVILPLLPGHSTTELVGTVLDRYKRPTLLGHGISLERDILCRRGLGNLVQALVVVIASLMYVPYGVIRGRIRR